MTILDPKSFQDVIAQQTQEKAVLIPIEWVEAGEQKKANVYIKKIQYSESLEIEKSYHWEPVEDEPGLMRLESIDHHRLRAAQIYASICVDEDGTLMFTSVDQVVKARPEVCQSLWTASNNINTFVGKPQTKNSAEMKSGQSLSSTELAEKPLPKPKERCKTVNSNSGSTTEPDVEV